MPTNLVIKDHRWTRFKLTFPFSGGLEKFFYPRVFRPIYRI
jgi:hypothetical protein